MRVPRRLLPGLIAAALVAAAAGCASRAEEGLPSGPRAAGAPSAASPAIAPFSADVLAETRELSIRYWETFNSYDLEGVLSLLEPSYAEARRGELESDISQVERFGVTLHTDVLEEPRWTGEDTAEMAFRMRTPIDVRRVLMRFVRSGENWLITFAEQQE